MPRHEGRTTTDMAPDAGLKMESLQEIADNVARSLSYARASGTSAFITTAVTYANGSAAVVRIDEDQAGFFVSDDGYGALTAEMMGALPTFNTVAGAVAKRGGVEFDQRSFFVVRVQKEQLPGAVAVIANVSAQAVERTIYAMDQVKTKRSRATFEARLRDAFGKRVSFGAVLRGATRQWDVDGFVTSATGVSSVFEFVSPAYSAVASAHMKLGDIRSLTDAPHVAAVLADYAKTEPALRSILSGAADYVFAADEDIAAYQRAA